MKFWSCCGHWEFYSRLEGSQNFTAIFKIKQKMLRTYILTGKKKKSKKKALECASKCSICQKKQQTTPQPVTPGKGT